MTLEARVDGMRREFDASFSRPSSALEDEAVQLLLVRAGASSLALRLDELSLLERAGAIVPVPGGSPALLGVAAVRGRLVAVHDVARVLASSGLPADDAGVGFIAIARRDPTIALALSRVEGRVAVAPEHVRGATGLLTLLPIEDGARRLLSVSVFVGAVSRSEDEVRT